MAGILVADGGRGFTRGEAEISEYNKRFDLILYVPSTIFQLNRDGSSWVEPVLS